MADENQIREAAYFNWLNKGCPENADVDCWLEAENANDVCPCCGTVECSCGADCDCRKEGNPCAEKPLPKKKRACKKATATEEKKVAKKTTTKKTAKK